MSHCDRTIKDPRFFPPFLLTIIHVHWTAPVIRHMSLHHSFALALSRPEIILADALTFPNDTNPPDLRGPELFAYFSPLALFSSSTLSLLFPRVQLLPWQRNTRTMPKQTNTHSRAHMPTDTQATRTCPRWTKRSLRDSLSFFELFPFF